MCPEHTGLDPEVGLQTQGEGRVSRGAGRYDAGREYKVRRKLRK